MKWMRKALALVLLAAMVAALFAGSAGARQTLTAAESMPEASGTTVYSNNRSGSCVKIDASHTDDGYVMINYTGAAAKLKVILTGPDSVKYTYNLRSDGVYETFGLTSGDGSYSIGVYKNIKGTSYSTLYSKTITVKMDNEFAPFLRPNQYVNYTADSDVVAKAAELAKDCKTDFDIIEAAYDYAVKNITYDKAKAQSVKSGYLPDVDEILESKTGICFDYAAVVTAMLRSQGIPTKLIVGYAGSAYHAWISTWTAETGWMTTQIYFDGKTWKRMDPTFASSANSSEAILQYIGDGSHYSQKYQY